MEFKLSKEEQKELSSRVESNQFHRYLKNKSSMAFEVGDVLIKTCLRYVEIDKYSWKAESVSYDNPMPQRYVYVFEDEYGIGYLKQLKVSTGTLGIGLFCLTDFDYTNTKFEVDPEYAEHVLLDANFDIKLLHKKSLEARKIVSQMNRKIGVRCKTLAEFNAFFDSLNIGDSYWVANDYTCKNVIEHELKHKLKINVTDLEDKDSWIWSSWKEKHLPIDAAHTYHIKSNCGWNDDRSAFEYDGYVLFKQKPAVEEKK